MAGPAASHPEGDLDDDGDGENDNEGNGITAVTSVSCYYTGLSGQDQSNCNTYTFKCCEPG